MKSLLLLLIVSLVGCGTLFKSNPSRSTPGSLSQLATKSNNYVDLVASHRDVNGFIMTNKCDALLFSGLLGAAVPGTVDILAARDSEERWHRRPMQDCGPEFGNSRSSISRDMIVGLMWHIWRNKDLDTAVALMEQVKGNLYALKGQGTAGELLMTPSMLNTLAEMVKAMGGPEYKIELLLPTVFGQDTGFIAHLTVWHIHLRGEVLGSISEDELDILQFHAERNKQNPLFQAAYHRYLDGNQEVAVHLLLDVEEWPASRLPTNQEHCDDWPIQRDYKENDWGPCESEREHTGAELVAIYELLIKKAS